MPCAVYKSVIIFYHTLLNNLFQVTTCEIPQRESTQEETDTRVVLYLLYASQLGHKVAVMRTPDTDIFFIPLHHTQSVPLTTYVDIRTRKHRRILNVSELTECKGADYCTTILGLYVFTREDVTSTFWGKGNAGPLKKLQSNPKYHAAFKWVFLVRSSVACNGN